MAENEISQCEEQIQLYLNKLHQIAPTRAQELLQTYVNGSDQLQKKTVPGTSHESLGKSVSSLPYKGQEHENLDSNRNAPMAYETPARSLNTSTNVPRAASGPRTPGSDYDAIFDDFINYPNSDPRVTESAFSLTELLQQMSLAYHLACVSIRDIDDHSKGSKDGHEQEDSNAMMLDG